jgi:hypothetical protein
MAGNQAKPQPIVIKEKTTIGTATAMSHACMFFQNPNPTGLSPFLGAEK